MFSEKYMSWMTWISSSRWTNGMRLSSSKDRQTNGMYLISYYMYVYRRAVKNALLSYVLPWAKWSLCMSFFHRHGMGGTDLGDIGIGLDYTTFSSLLSTPSAFLLLWIKDSAILRWVCGMWRQVCLVNNSVINVLVCIWRNKHVFDISWYDV